MESTSCEAIPDKVGPTGKRETPTKKASTAGMLCVCVFVTDVCMCVCVKVIMSVRERHLS